MIDQTKKIWCTYHRLVIWGFKSPDNDSFRHIFQSYYDTAQKLAISVIWVDDTVRSRQVIRSGDLVLAVNIQAKNLPIKKGVYYCLHNFDAHVCAKIGVGYLLKLQVYTSDADKGTKKIGPARRFDAKQGVLYQPWGTDLYPHEFLTPVSSHYRPWSYWVGSIWDNEQHQGNLTEIRALKWALLKRGIFFIHRKFASDAENIRYMRASRLAPAIAGSWQVEKNYLPCRLFKNISYGQLGVTNVPKFKEIFGNNIIYDRNIDRAVKKALKLPAAKWEVMIQAQQEIVRRDYTYVNSLYYIAKAFSWLKN